MEFRFTPEQEAFRQEIRDFVRAHPPESYPTQHEDEGFGYGFWSYEFGRVMGQQGWISLDWPEEYGGKNRPLMDLFILLDELAYLGAPTMATFMGMPLGRMLIDHGNETLKKTFLPGIASGEMTFWMALSEPQAGSDLLAMETRAVEDGDSFLISGQKVWSSAAHLADYAYLVARTNFDVPRHKGISMFIMPKNLPGVSVRPIISMAGIHVHNEVFMDNVRVPKEYLVGQKDQGFYQMLKTLEVDRFWGRFIKPPFCRRVLDMLVKYCKETRRDGQLLAKDPLVRHKLASSAVEIEACRMIFYHAGWMMAKELPLTYEATMGTILADEMGQRLFDKGLQIMGPYGLLGEDTKWAPLRAQLKQYYLLSPGHLLAGGTSEILRNTLATIGLKLPRA